MAQKRSQEHLQSPSASRVVVEPCHGSLETRVREGATVTNDTDDRPEDTTVTGEVVVGAVVKM